MVWELEGPTPSLNNSNTETDTDLILKGSMKHGGSFSAPLMV
jgi:hypothetical protein